MKKYSSEYFKKKFEILLNKLIIKEGLVNEIKEVRKGLGIPVKNGFLNSSELAEFLLKKLKKSEKERLIILAFINKYELETHTQLSEKDIEDRDKFDEFFKYFFKKRIKRDNSIIIGDYFQTIIEDHINLFTSNTFLKETNFFSKLSPIVFRLFNKYLGFDLLDELITMHFVEKYLFLGENGVNQYIRAKVACPMCKYIGVDHFSPDRRDMQGQDKGAFSKNYIFNKKFVRRLSMHFNSAFLLIKPYATKEEVLNYIEDNWNCLKEHLLEKNTFYRQLDVNPSKIKESNFDRNRLIYSLYKLSKKELLKRYKGQENFSGRYIYKERIISAILEEEYNIKMSQDAIKKTATRFAKSIKLKKEPRDIRDI